MWMGTRSPSAHRSWVAGEPVHMERTKIKQSVNFFVEAVRIPVRLCGSTARRELRSQSTCPTTTVQDRDAAGLRTEKGRARLKRGQGLRAEWEIDDCGSAGTGRCTVAKCGRE